jgi:fibronectin type 3 domain-containing protein
MESKNIKMNAIIKIFRNFLFVYLFFGGVSYSLAQEIKNEVPKIELKYHIIAKAYEDSIVLRFAPTTPNALPAHIESGINIDQKVVKGKFPYQIDEWTSVNKTPIKPWPLIAFNTEEYKKNKDLMLVAQALYGNILSSKTDEISKVKEQAESLSNLFYLSLLSADYDANAANSYGLRHVIKTKIKPDEKLFFRIYSNFNHPLFKVDTTMTFVTYGEWDANNNPSFLFIQNKEKAVELKWPVNRELYRWSGFYIERSEDGNNFTRVNKKPFLVFRDDTKYDATYVDSLKQNYKKYFYRIQAIDPFGDLTGYSQTVEGMGVDLTAPGQVSLEEQSDNGNGIKLSWTFLEGAPKDLDYFVIKKGSYINNITDSVITIRPGTYNYFYSEKAKTRSTYFEVHAVDTAGNVRVSNPVRYFLPDTEPPLPPKEFKAKIDTNGVVSLKWQLDTLDELIGYRVYRNNNKDHKFVCLQEGYLEDTIYHDTLNLKTLTDEVYYAVCAVDLSYNHGKMTEAVRLVKPDILPPYPPNIIDYKVSDGKVTFTWTPSPSEDVVSYSIIRKYLSTNEETNIKIGIPKSESSYTDENLKHGVMYEYSITAVDEVGLISKPSFPLTIKAYSNKVTENITLKTLSDNEQSGIEWTIPKDKPLYYIIYKDNGNGLQQYANANANENKYVERNNSTAKNYGLQAIYPNQVKSEIFTLIK